MLYEHNESAWLVREARRLIAKARATTDEAARDALLSAASHAVTRAERLMQPPIVIMAEVA